MRAISSRKYGSHTPVATAVLELRSGAAEELSGACASDRVRVRGWRQGPTAGSHPLPHDARQNFLTTLIQPALNAALLIGVDAPGVESLVWDWFVGAVCIEMSEKVCGGN